MPGSGQSALDRAVAAADRDAQDKDGGKKKKCASSPSPVFNAAASWFLGTAMGT